VNKNNEKNLSVSAFGRNLKKEANRTELELTTFITPVGGISVIYYFWRTKKPQEDVSTMLIQYTIMKATQLTNQVTTLLKCDYIDLFIANKIIQSISRSYYFV
jgi:hypothetical protein